MLGKLIFRVPPEDGRGRATVLFDGEPLKGITNTEIRFSVKDAMPTVTVDLAVHEVDYFGDVRLAINDRARLTLLRFGWTPPADEVSTDA